MAAPKGNQYKRKLKTEESRSAAFQSYCNWIAKGNAHRSWTYEDGDQRLSYKSIMRYIRDFPEDCPLTHKDFAEAKNLEIWIQRGLTMMSSKERCQPAIYQMMMRNIHGWDKESLEEKAERETKIKEEKSMLQTLFDELRKK